MSESTVCEHRGVSVCVLLQVMDFLGSAAFSKAVQALDTKTGMLVCLKIIKVTMASLTCQLLAHLPNWFRLGRSQMREISSHELQDEL